MAKNKVVLFFGCGAILLALIIVLSAVFLPRLAAKREMKALLEKAISDAPIHVTYTDPRYENEGLLAGEGRETQLDGELLVGVRASLSLLCEDFSFARSSRKSVSGLDKRLWVKTAEGENVQLYFTETSFYYVEGERTYYFTPDDATSYAALLAALDAALQ